MELILNTNGMTVLKKNNCFFLKKDEKTRLISPKRLTSIIIVSNLNISTAAIELAIKNEIPIIILSKSGKVLGTLSSASYKSIATNRRNQIRFADTIDATKFIIHLFELKFDEENKNFKWLLNHYDLTSEHRNKWDDVKKIVTRLRDFENLTLIKCKKKLLGLEGSIAKIYWELVAASIGKNYGFSKRRRRPATDIFNALLNYWYGMLYGKIERAIFSVGLDAYSGFLHADEYKKPTLAFDLIEPFRPWIDWLLFKNCLENNILDSDFDFKDKACFLNRSGKIKFIPLFNNFMEERVAFRSLIKTRYNHILSFTNELVRLINQIKL